MTNSTRSRLDKLEDAHEEIVKSRWYMFMEKFSDDDIDALIDETASPDLVKRWLQVLTLAKPREVIDELESMAG